MDAILVRPAKCGEIPRLRKLAGGNFEKISNFISRSDGRMPKTPAVGQALNGLPGPTGQRAKPGRKFQALTKCNSLLSNE